MESEGASAPSGPSTLGTARRPAGDGASRLAALGAGGHRSRPHDDRGAEPPSEGKMFRSIRFVGAVRERN